MGSIGVVAIATSAKKELSGPPFVSGSADNGLSVDSTSGKIVLGNDVGDPAAPAQLLSNREIITEDLIGNTFGVTLNANQTGITTTADGRSILISSANGSTPDITVTDSLSGNPQLQVVTSGGLGGTASVNVLAANNDIAQIKLQAGGDELRYSASGAGTVTFTGPSNVDVMALDTTTFQWIVGPGLTGGFNGADFAVTGSATYRRFVISKAAGAYNVDRDLDTNKLFTNSAANTFNLPNMVGSNNRLGFIFRLTIGNVGGSTIQLNAGQQCRFGSLITSVAGTLASVDVGATITIVWTGGIWITESYLGAWTLT